MTTEMICAGFGGQGVLTIGRFIAQAAMKEGRNVSWLPSYGPEMRGGTANVSTVVSDEIASKVIMPSPQLFDDVNEEISDTAFMEAITAIRLLLQISPAST